MAVLAIQEHGAEGGGVTPVSATQAGDTIPVDGTTALLIVNNSGATSHDVTISGRPCDQGFSHDLVVTVGTSATVYSPILSVERFGRRAAISYDASSGTDLDVACVRLTTNKGVAT